MILEKPLGGDLTLVIGNPYKNWQGVKMSGNYLMIQTARSEPKVRREK